MDYLFYLKEAIDMRFTKTAKKVLSVVMAAAVTATTVLAVPQFTQKADAASSVTAYLCFSSKSYNGVLSNHNDTNRSKGVMNGNKTSSLSGVKVTNATIKKGKFSVTVSASGSKLKSFSSDGGWNAIYVDTSLAGSSKKKLKVTSATLTIDGKTVKTIKNPALTPDPGKTDNFTQVMIVNTWNNYAEKKYKAASCTKMPKKSISVTISGTLK
jgi:hypothetical protein